MIDLTTRTWGLMTGPTCHLPDATMASSPWLRSFNLGLDVATFRTSEGMRPSTQRRRSIMRHSGAWADAPTSFMPGSFVIWVICSPHSCNPSSIFLIARPSVTSFIALNSPLHFANQLFHEGNGAPHIVVI